MPWPGLPWGGIGWRGEGECEQHEGEGDVSTLPALPWKRGALLVPRAQAKGASATAGLYCMGKPRAPV